MASADQLRVITSTLHNYFNELSLNLLSTGNLLPSFEDFVAALAYDVIQTDAVQGSLRSASYSTGALSDSVHLVAAVIREFGMRSKLKAQYFEDAEFDADTIVGYIDALFGQYLNYYRGTSPEQGTD